MKKDCCIYKEDKICTRRLVNKMRELASRTNLDLLMNQKQVALFAQLYRQLGVSTDEQLAAQLNRNLPAKDKFSRVSIRRWSIGTQSIGKANRAKLATALGYSPELIDAYFSGRLTLGELLNTAKADDALSQDEQVRLVDDFVEKASGLSVPILSSAIARLSQLISAKWNHLHASTSIPDKTIGQLLQENWDEAVIKVEGMVAIERMRRIADGDKPTEIELEPLSIALDIDFEELELMYRREFGTNGHSAECKHPR